MKSIGVQVDRMNHSNVVTLRAITSDDGMTAYWCAFVSLPLHFIFVLISFHYTKKGLWGDLKPPLKTFRGGYAFIFYAAIAKS